MRDYKGYILDLDGTIYRGNQVIVEAREFVQWLAEEKIPYLFLTNNSSMTPERIAWKLQNMGIPCVPEQVYTTAMAAAEYISSAGSGTKVMAIGEEGLLTALAKKGLEIHDSDPDYVVVGIDRSFTYEKMAKASLAIQKGAQFISTNSDRAIPTEIGLVPGNGALTMAISVASGVDPLYMGKPEALFVELALRKLNLGPEEVLLIGDNLQTDIAAGVSAHVDTLLVYTGFTRPEDLEESNIQPTYTASDLNQWLRKRQMS